MRKFLPLAGIGCVAILVLALIVGGAIMLIYGISASFKKKEVTNPPRKTWVVPKEGLLPPRGIA